MSPKFFNQTFFCSSSKIYPCCEAIVIIQAIYRINFFFFLLLLLISGFNFVRNMEIVYAFKFHLYSDINITKNCFTLGFFKCKRSYNLKHHCPYSIHLFKMKVISLKQWRILTRILIFVVFVITLRPLYSSTVSECMQWRIYFFFFLLGGSEDWKDMEAPLQPATIQNIGYE